MLKVAYTLPYGKKISAWEKLEQSNQQAINMAFAEMNYNLYKKGFFCVKLGHILLGRKSKDVEWRIEYVGLNGKNEELSNFGHIMVLFASIFSWTFSFG